MTNSMRARVQMLLVAGACVAMAASAAALTPAFTRDPGPAVSRQQGPTAVAATRRTPDHVLVQMFRGRTQPSREEVSVTTIFRESAFTVIGDADINGGSEDELRRQVGEIFSLKEMVSLGSSIVPLAGGSALLDDDGHRVSIRLTGQPVGGLAARLVVSETHDDQEVVASSVIARSGKTVVLAGPPVADAAGGRRIDFVCLTPFR